MSRPLVNRRLWAVAAASLLLVGVRAPAQAAGKQPAQTQQNPTEPAKQDGQDASPPSTPSADPAVLSGTVLFSRDASDEPGVAPNMAPKQPASPEAQSSINAADGLGPGDDDPLKVTDAERDALTFTSYDLDVHLIPVSAGIRVRAALTVRNDGKVPLKRLVLQVSSSLRWESFSGAVSGAGPSTALAHLEFTARRVATDADHTGWAEEAVVDLPQPLAPGQSIALITLYSGAIPQSGERLERIGAPSAQAADADWDAIAGGKSPNSDGTAAPGDATALRGFGDVLWYPVASPPLFLGDGAKLFQAIGLGKQRQSSATVRLRLATEFTGDAPDAAFFCGRRATLTAIRDNPDLPAAESPGVATAVFDAQPLGFRTLSLFVTGHAASHIGTPAEDDLIWAVSDHNEALDSYSAAATLVEPLLTDWFGKRPQTSLNLLDHSGQPFEEDALLVRPMRLEEASVLARSLAHSLTHAWIHSSHPWIDEGLAQFAGLLWTEQTQGRAAALNALQEDARVVALAEPAASGSQPGGSDGSDGSVHPAEAPPGPEPSSSSSFPEAAPVAAQQSFGGQSLVAATSDVFYRTKAAAVWWMLRSITGDEALKQALQAYRLDPKLDADPQGFERTIERTSHKDLRWFFDNWVDHDRGLMDLSIVNVTPRQLDAHNGLPAGWLISVEVRNDSDAEADVPIVVRSAARAGSAAATETLTPRIPAHSTISRRLVFAGTPDEVQVNDGGVPETGTSVHTRKLVLPAGR